jgi:hypothetical protein
MQLRVARLCLDCEELHTDNACPRCASESYAFLSNWLHVEERRRWRRQGTPEDEGSGKGLGRSLGQWLRRDKASAHAGPRTRASDHVPNLDFDEAEAKEHKPAARTRLNVGLSKNRAR